MTQTSPALSFHKIAFLLAALSAIGPFAIDTYLPAFASMSADLNASQQEVQLTLSAYMATFAVMALCHGALADRFGRRIVIIISMAIFAVASLLCTFATSIEWLWAGRALQGMVGGAGMIAGRAVIRDLFDGAQALRLMSQVMMIFGVAPAVAPLIGGLLLETFGWRSIFLFMSFFSALLCWTSWRFLPETLPVTQRQSLHPATLGRGYWKVLSNVAFLMLAMAIAFNFNGFFLYVLSAPVFIMQHLELRSTQFIWLFGPAVIGMIGGSMLAGRLASRWSTVRTISLGFAIMICGALTNVLYSALMPPGVPGSVLPIAVYCFGSSVAMPGLALFAFDLFPQNRGMVSSCQSFVQIGVNATSSALIAPLLWSTPLTLSAGASLFLSLGLLAFTGWKRHTRRHPPQNLTT